MFGFVAYLVRCCCLLLFCVDLFWVNLCLFGLIGGLRFGVVGYYVWFVYIGGYVRLLVVFVRLRLFWNVDCGL